MKKNKQQYDHMAGCRALRARDDDDDDDDDGGGGGSSLLLLLLPSLTSPGPTYLLHPRAPQWKPGLPTYFR